MIYGEQKIIKSNYSNANKEVFSFIFTFTSFMENSL